MTDGYGREIDYLRISLTDKCNLRCSYCMPSEGVRHIEHKDILTLEETGRLAHIMSELGIRRVRLTGGEPLVRRGITDLIRILRAECDLNEISMTSNGLLLSECAGKLYDAGLTDINISLDTLREECFSYITGCDGRGLKDVLDGIDRAIETGFGIKLNCVPVKGVNEEDIIPLAEYAADKDVRIRFIELMPIGCAGRFERISTDELIRRLEERYGASTPVYYSMKADDKGPAEYYTFKEYSGQIGFISPISHKFCDRCRRIRLTAEGFLKLCLQYPDGVDLKLPLRNGAKDEELKKLILDAVRVKPAAHSFDSSRDSCDGTDKRRMVEIGG